MNEAIKFDEKTRTVEYTVPGPFISEDNLSFWSAIDDVFCYMLCKFGPNFEKEYRLADESDTTEWTDDDEYACTITTYYFNDEDRDKDIEVKMHFKR